LGLGWSKVKSGLGSPTLPHLHALSGPICSFQHIFDMGNNPI
jgi:hypothetical protein